MTAIQELYIEAAAFWDNISPPQFEVQLQALRKSANHVHHGMIIWRALQLQKLALARGAAYPSYCDYQ
jgi:hypothetical protein